MLLILVWSDPPFRIHLWRTVNVHERHPRKAIRMLHGNTSWEPDLESSTSQVLTKSWQTLHYSGMYRSISEYDTL